MKSCLITLGLLLLLGCGYVAPQTFRHDMIFQLDNKSEFGIGSFHEGFNFASGTKSDSANLIISPYKDTTGKVLGVILFDPLKPKNYSLDFRFQNSHNEASHYYNNYEVLYGSTQLQKVFIFNEGTVITSNQFMFDSIPLKEYKAEINDIFLYDNKILIHIISTSIRQDGYVNIYFKYRRIYED